MADATKDLEGRIALVTGASRGIGRAIARALAAAGADVAVSFRTRESQARATESEIRSLGRRCVVVRADVSRSGDVARLVATVERELGAISILVNNAGVTRTKLLAELDERDFDEMVAVNLKPVFLLTQAVLPSMRARRFGRIVNLSSIAAQSGGVIGPHYAASKAGILGLTHSYAALLAKEGVTVNAIAPALIDTEMIAGNPDARPELLPVGRFGTVDEVAEVAVLLARNGFVTGQTINVNGGWHMS